MIEFRVEETLKIKKKPVFTHLKPFREEKPKTKKKKTLKQTQIEIKMTRETQIIREWNEKKPSDNGER